MSKWDQFMLAMYWSFATMTTVAYGDITPMNPIEIQVAQVAMIFAVFFFAFNI
jgi:Ion channel